MTKKEKGKEKAGKTIKMDGLKELPITAISFGLMDWNETGNWRYCTVDCPAGENIPRYMLNAAHEEHEEAWRLLVKDNPFPATCGRICDYPCEAVCLRKDFDETVGIRDVERFLGEMAIGNWSMAPPKVVKDDRVAVIGGGPSGLSCAYYLAQFGYTVTLIEKNEILGGSLRTVTPGSLLPPKILDGEIDNILSMGIEVRKEITPDNPPTIDEMLKEYKALFLATGVPRTNQGADGAFPGDTVKMENGRVVVNEHCQTSRDSIFAGGGIVEGKEMSVAEAIGWGKRAARAIDRYIKGMLEGRVEKKKEYVTFENLNLDHFVKEERNRPAVIKAGDGDTADQVETLERDAAVREAGRCFNCGICIYCDNCMIFCPDVAIDKVGRGYKIDYYHCKGCGVCVFECPRDSMSMESELKWKK
jgi:Pyruvate/2-oxoacid:ferredoxin oxidoreductase delta subunit